MIGRARTEPDSQVIVTGWPVTITFFHFKMVSYCIAIMHDDIGKFGYDSINKNKKDKINEKYLTKDL